MSEELVGTQAEAVRARLAAAGWRPRADGVMERVWPGGAPWRCSFGAADAGPRAGDVPEGLRLDRSGPGSGDGAEVLVIDVLGFADPAGMFDAPADRLAAVLDILAAAPVEAAGAGFLRTVLKPLLARAAVFRERSALPIGIRGFMRDDLPHRPSGPLAAAVAAAKAMPDDPARWLDTAFAALDVELLHVALAAFDRALAAGADAGLAELWRGWLLKEADPVEAEAALERAVAAAGAADSGVTGAALCLLASLADLVPGGRDRELALLARATQEAPAFLRGWLERGLALAKSGRADEALRVLNQAAARHPDAAVRYYRGYARSLLGDADAALDDLAEAIRLDPAITGEIFGDSDLAGLRGHKGFGRLTDRLAAQNRQDPELTDRLRRLAKAMAAGAPDGWRSIAVRASPGRIGGGIGSHKGHYVLDDGSWTYHSHGGLQDELAHIAQLAARHDPLYDEFARLGVTHTPPVTIMLAVHASGWFEAAVATGAGLDERRTRGDQGGVHFVLDGAALPDEPGDDQDGPVDPTQAGDPAEAVRLLRTYLRRRAEILGEPEELPAPAPDLDELDDEEISLPDDLRALYDELDGDGNIGLFDNDFMLLSASDLVDVAINRPWEHWDTSLADPVTTIGESGPPGAVRRCLDRPGWIPFAHDWSADYLAVDMDPAAGGRPGQVIRVGMHREGPTYVTDSVTSLLRAHLDALDRGDWSCADGGLTIDLGDLARDREHEHEAKECSVRGDEPLHDVDLDERTQRLVVRGGGDVDLDPIRGSRLLSVELCCASADLGPLRDTPVEVLTLLDVQAVDLAPLAGHPTLRAVTVRAPHTVDIAPMLTVPRLYALDLGGCQVLDLAVLARLARLRYLALRHDQWLEVWQRNVPLPHLALAVLHGDPSPSTTAAWARQLTERAGWDSAPVRHYVGQFEPRR